MRLTAQTDYALRMMLHLAALDKDTVADLIQRNLMLHNLTKGAA